jgi:hypothetical protein
MEPETPENKPLGALRRVRNGLGEAGIPSKMNYRDCNYGPVINPLPTDWSAFERPGWSQEALNAEIRQRVRIGRLRRFRSIPVLRRVWFVTLTATWVSESEFTVGELVPGLTFAPTEFWCHSRRKANRLINADIQAGGSGSKYAVEYRRCLVCGRALLGPEATSYRERQLMHPKTWAWPAGPACNIDCKPKEKT